MDPVRPNHKEWISQETLKKVDERRERKAGINNSRTRAQKSKAQREYREVNKSVRQKIKQDKVKFIEGLADEAKAASNRGSLRKLYSLIRKMSGKFNKSERPVKDNDGQPILDGEGQKKRWAEHFEELLNRPDPHDPQTYNLLTMIWTLTVVFLLRKRLEAP